MLSYRWLRPTLWAAVACVLPIAASQSQAVTKSLRRDLVGTSGLLHTRNEGTGLGLTGSYALGTEFVALTLTPLGLGVMPQDPNGRFRSETFSNGHTACRDHDTGQFGHKSDCGPRFIYAASADAIGALPIGDGRLLSAGVGYRAGNSQGPYGIAAIHFGPIHGKSWRLSMRAGSSFFDVTVGGALPVKWPS